MLGTGNRQRHRGVLRLTRALRIAAKVRPVNVLIVGAGAVGVSYADALVRGGARVSFYVRPARVEQVRAGLTLHELRMLGAAHTRTVDVHEVLSTPDEVAARSFDQVWLTVPSDALDQPWLPELCRAAPDATIVSYQPGLHARGVIEAAAGAERLVMGVIVLIAWHSPLPGESLAPGVAAWFPPFAATPLSGPGALTVRDAFRRGGVSARVVRDAAADSGPVAALLQMVIASLECEGWALGAFVRSDGAGLALRAARQATAIEARASGRRPGFVFRLVRPWLLRLVRPIASALFPGDLEAYLRAHFTKVGGQTALVIAEYLKLADDLPSDAIQELGEALRAARLTDKS